MGNGSLLSNIFSGIKSAATAPLRILAFPATAAGSLAVKTSNLVKSAVNEPPRAIQSQASSLFQRVGQGIQTFFTPTPRPTTKSTFSLGGILSDATFAARDIVLGRPDPSGGFEGGLIGDVLRNKLLPKRETPILQLPAASATPPGSGVGVLRDQSQPVGLFSVGFPTPPPSPTQGDINVIQGDGQAVKGNGINPIIWALLALIGIGVVAARAR